MARSLPTLFSIEGVADCFCENGGPSTYRQIITTGGLIPVEIFELARHFSVAKGVVLFVNVLIVVYLVERVRASQ